MISPTSTDFFRGFRELVDSEDPIAFPGGFDPDGVNSLGVTLL